jgi:predicted phosphodiesterase
MIDTELEEKIREYHNSNSPIEKEFLTPETLYDLLVEENTEHRPSPKKKKDDVAGHIAAIEYFREVLKVPKFSLPKKTLSSDSETAVFEISDTHFGKEIKDQNGNVIYNTKIATQRLYNVFANGLKLIKRVNHTSSIEELIIVLNGDIIDGDSIYPTQQAHIECSPPEQMAAFAKAFISVLKLVSPEFKQIQIFCVKGNHGRSSRYAAEESNYDLALYMQLEFLLDELRQSTLKNVYFTYSKSDFLNFQVRDWNIHARHIGPKHASSYGEIGKLSGWQSEYNIDIMLTGHWHNFANFDVNNSMTVFQNSSLVGGDDFSERLGLFSAPGQWLFGVSNKRKITWSYRVDVKA